MNLQPNSSDAQNATTPLENIHKLCAFPSPETKGNIFTVALKLRERGYSESYLSTLIRALTKIAKNADLNSSSEVLLYIAKLKCQDSYKANLCDFYKHYSDYYKIIFVKPKYRREHRLPYVPTREELSLIISHASKKYALIYSILRDTGLRPVELSTLTPSNIDQDKGVISIYSAKHKTLMITLHSYVVLIA